MLRIAKEKVKENVEKETKKKTSTVAKKTATVEKVASDKSEKATKKATTAKKATTKKAVSDTVAKKASTVKKSSAAKEKESTTTKKSTAKKTTATKKATTTAKKTATKKATTSKKPTSTSKKATTTKKTATKRTTSKKKAESNVSNDIQILEYYDLPYKYGNTIVKLLAQTPKTLFVYWEISDEDINDFKKLYGEDFFDITKPILLVHNLTLNKTSEIEVNDFANCWYLNIDNADCKFDIELARKFTKRVTKPKKANIDEYLYVAKSNKMDSPNDHIMFEKLSEVVIFKNSKTNERIEENINSFEFLRNIYKFYQNMYKDELLKNPSSKF